MLNCKYHRGVSAHTEERRQENTKFSQIRRCNIAVDHPYTHVSTMGTKMAYSADREMIYMNYIHPFAAPRFSLRR
ncbi:hypothetical protein I7I48_09374 [Histoplasma ohiense]|nr:hypothetical protein I7I48_09374 [Histoplasma ohiense (nom. inval.)]